MQQSIGIGFEWNGIQTWLNSIQIHLMINGMQIDVESIVLIISIISK
jgi:hypothetical protein